MKAEFYTTNRKNLYSAFGQNSLFVLCSGGQVHRTADDYFRFFANRSYVYLTGIDEPDCRLMAWEENGEIKEALFIRDMDAVAEIRGGRRITKEEAAEISGICDVRYMSEFEGAFHRLARDIYYKELYLCLESNTGQQITDQNHIFQRKAQDEYPGLEIKNAFPQISELRSIKSDEEIANMKKALEITKEGIIRMMQASKKAEYEYELFAEFMYAIHKNGYVEPAFKPIVSCGKDNFYLHYDNPTGKLYDNEFCLTDVGAMVDFCCVDISRVFPRNGKFTEKQKQIYKISYEINNEITDEIKPGMDFSAIDLLYKKKAFPRLKAIGLLKEKSELSKYVWHGLSHHVGFDVHDVGTYKTSIKENMVFTMDTGIYVREWGIGMRIEDNVLVGKNGLECLSKDIPRSIKDIENIMA